MPEETAPAEDPPALKRRSPLEAGKHFVKELRRRHVFKVGTAYIALVFALVQVAEPLFRVLLMPPWAYRVVIILALFGAPVVFVLAWVFDLTPEGVRRTDAIAPVPAVVAMPLAEPIAVSARSVAVLPFSNMSGDEANDYFSDGMTEDIIVALSHVRDIKVVSRTSVMQYKGTVKSLREIGRELGAASVVEGSIRRAGERVRIVAKLVDTRIDQLLWAETYDRGMEDLFAIQSDVARRVAQALHAELSTEADALLDEQPTQDLGAYDLFLQARHLWNQRTEVALREAITRLHEALAADGDFALAWAALAECNVTLGIYGAARPNEVMDEARSAAERALALDPALVEALTARAAIRAYADWDWSGAAELFSKAVEASPRYATAHHWRSNLLAQLGAFDDARTSLERARALDPLSPAILTSAGIISYLERSYQRAGTELQQVLDRNPGFPLAHMFLGLSRAAMGRHPEAITSLHNAVALSGGSIETRVALAYAVARSGDARGARTIVDGLDSASYVSPVLRASANIGLGDLDTALGDLEEGLYVRAADMVSLRVKPVFDPLRGHPRFEKVLDAIGLGAKTRGPVATA